MKITIEGTEEECERASVALARGWRVPIEMPSPPKPDQRDALLKSLEGSDQSEHGYVPPEVRECCKTGTCRLSPSHPDYRSDP